MSARHEVNFSKRSNLELCKIAELNTECSFFYHNKSFWFMGRFGRFPSHRFSATLTHFPSPIAQHTTPTPTWLNCRVESRRLSAVCIEFATSSRRLPTCLVEKLKTEHSSWVVSGEVYSPVGSRDPVSNFAANSDWINSQHVQFSIFRPNPSWTSCEFNTDRRRDSTRQLSRVVVGGVYHVQFP